MNDFVKIKYEIEEIKEALTTITNKIPSRIAEVYEIESGALDKTLEFTVKNYVDLEIIVIGGGAAELKIYLDGAIIDSTAEKAAAIRLNCIGDRKHSLRIVISGAGLEVCYLCLTAPKIKKL